MDQDAPTMQSAPESRKRKADQMEVERATSSARGSSLSGSREPSEISEFIEESPREEMEALQKKLAEQRAEPDATALPGMNLLLDAIQFVEKVAWVIFTLS